jgi:hypothetical protein
MIRCFQIGIASAGSARGLIDCPGKLINANYLMCRMDAVTTIIVKCAGFLLP